MQHMHKHRGLEAFAEHRLLRKMPKIEVLHEQIFEQLKESDVAQAESLLKNSSEMEKNNILENVSEALKRNKELNQKQKEQISANLDLLCARTLEKQETDAEQKKEILLDPRTWSPETTKKAADVGKVALVAGATGIALFLLHKFMRGAKKVKEQVVEKSKTGFSVAKWLLFGALLTGLGYGAWKVYDKYHQIAPVLS